MAVEKIADLPLLDVLRAPCGFETDAAWIATYSVDLVAVVACLIALAGEESDGEMPPTSVATAIRRLTGRVRVVAQAGRVQVPSKGGKVLRMADRWIREIHLDGREASWHPKAALVRQSGPGGTRWVLWLGSRNLTRDISWDLGLSIVGFSSDDPRRLPGLDALAATLADHAALDGWPPEKLVEELRHVRWNNKSTEFSFEELLLHGEGTPTALPSIPHKAARVLAISPFLDRGTLKQFGSWGGKGVTTRRLATTSEALRGIAAKGMKPLAGLDLFSMEPSSDAPVENDEDSEHHEAVHRGLHAKALLAWSPGAKRATLWMGSANLTKRAWGKNGKNVEISARLAVSRAVAEQLWAYSESSLFIHEHDYLKDLTRDDADAPSPLEELRNMIGGWDVPVLMLGVQGLEVRFPKPLAPPVGCTVKVGLFGGPSESWGSGETSVRLPAPELREWTELIEITLEMRGEDPVSFLLRGSWQDGIPVERDHHALSDLLGARAFLRWLIASLHGEPFHDGGTWPPPADEKKRKGCGRANGTVELLMPSLEAILRTWVDAPERLLTIDQRVMELAVLVRGAEAEKVEPDEDALMQLAEFEEQWAVIRAGLWGDGS